MKREQLLGLLISAAMLFAGCSRPQFEHALALSQQKAKALDIRSVQQWVTDTEDTAHQTLSYVQQITTYNTDHSESKQVFYNKDNTIRQTIFINYDSLGRWTTWITLDKDSNMKYYSTYTYEGDTLETEFQFNTDSTIFSKGIDRFDKNGNRVEYLLDYVPLGFGNADAKIIEQYDNRGRRVVHLKYLDEPDQLRLKITSSYGPEKDTVLTHWIEYSATGNVERHLIYRTDQTKKTMQIRKMYDQDYQLLFTTIEKFDKAGNLTKKVTLDTAGTLVTLEKHIRKRRKKTIIKIQHGKTNDRSVWYFNKRGLLLQERKQNAQTGKLETIVSYRYEYYKK